MRAAVFHRFGGPEVLELEDVERPTPGANEVLIRVRATTVTAGDCELRRLEFPLLFRLPMWVWAGPLRRSGTIPGQELSGVVEAVGADVTRFEQGDEVFAATLFRFGACAEHVCLPETYPIAAKPAGVSFAEAATIPTGGLNGLDFLGSASVGADGTLLINGAGGSIGTYAVQLAASSGAEVTCVDSGEKLDVLRSLGADHVVDYTREGFTERGETYDAVVDVVGTAPFARTLRCLNPNGRFVLGNPSVPDRVRGVWISRTTDRTVVSKFADYSVEAMTYLADRVADDRIRVVVDREYPLAEVADAHRYVETGRKLGHVVVTVGGDADASTSRTAATDAEITDLKRGPS